MRDNKKTIVIATDLHYLAANLQDGGEAFRQMMKFADGRLTDRSEEILRAFVRQMLRMKPDAVILTGDLTFNGERISHEAVCRELGLLRDAGIPVLTIPGNHDLENPLAGRYCGDEGLPEESISGEDYRSMYRPLLEPEPACDGKVSPAKVISAYPSSLGYVCELDEHLWILAVDVNGNTYPGEVSRGILAWAGEQLRRAQERQITVIGISHQNLLVHNEMLSCGYQMIGAEKLAELYRAYGVRLHLSGHMHIQHSRSSDGVTEIVTAALTLGRCRYAVLSVDLQTHQAEYRTEEMREFSDDAAAYFLQLCREKTLLEMSGMKFDEQTAMRLAEDLARLNLAYFEGRVDQIGDRETIRKAWKKEAPGSFWNSYIDSILAEEPFDHTRLTVALGQNPEL